MDWFELFCYLLCSAMLTLTAVGLCVAVVMPGMSRWNRRFFTALFTVLLFLMGAFLVDLIVYEFPDMALAEQIVVYFQYLLVSLPMLMFTGYLLHFCGEDLRKSTLFRIVIGLWIIYFILLGIAQCTTFLYYVTPDNQFIRGSWHPLLTAPLAAIMLFNLAGVIRRRKRLPDKYYVAFLIHLLPMTVATLIHTFIYVPLLVVFGLSLSMLSMFGIILCDQIEQYMRQQREIAHQRASIMVLQMRPHFIFNTMMSIASITFAHRIPKRPSRSPWISRLTCVRTFLRLPVRMPFPLQMNWSTPAPTWPLSRYSLKTAFSLNTIRLIPGFACRL